MTYGEPYRVIEYALSHHVVISQYIVGEIFAFLRKTEPRQPQKWLKALRITLSGMEYLENDDVDVPAVRDQVDEPIVRLARSHGAIIVSGDKDLLELNDAAVPVLSVADFTELFL